MRTMPSSPFDAAADATISAGLAHSEKRDVLTRIKNEFREMPGLCLTSVQAQRLWCLDESTCSLVLSTLVTEGFLRRSAIGYIKA
jgi:hypothetical protein